MPPVTDSHPAPAKITRPKSGDSHPRTRLFKLLDRARHKPLIWVMGPPGSGKTLLVADYLERRRVPTLWYQADSGDADIATFFHYLALAATKAAPRQRRPLPACTSDRLADLDHYARQFFAELYARLKTPFALVLDNYQDIPAEATLHEVLRLAAEALPEGSHIVAMSRMEPPASLARVRLNGGLAVLGDADLRLTLAEAQGIARHRLPERRARSRVAELHALTQGWAAGLVLMLEQSTATLPERAATFKTPGVLFEYFAAEVFEKTDPDTRAVLLKSVFLPTMTVRAVAELTGERRAGRILNHLSRNNFFTSRYDLPEPVFQYHPLFREFLRSRALRLLPADTLAALRRQSAALLEQSGADEAALELYAEARDWAGFGQCLTRLASELLAEGRTQALEHWLELMPAEELTATPWLLYWQASTRLVRDPRAGREMLERALTRFQETNEGRGACLAWSTIVNSILKEGTDYATLPHWIARHAALPAAGDADSAAQVAVSMLNALVLVEPQHPDIDLWSERAMTLLQSPTDAGMRISAGIPLAVRYLNAGQQARAAPVVRLLEEARRTPGVAPLRQVMAQNLAALFHWLSAEPAAALNTAREALTLAEPTGSEPWNASLLTHATAAALTGGDLDAAEEWLDRLALTLSGARAFDLCFYHYLCNWLALQRGDLPSALEHLAISERLGQALGLWFVEGMLQHARAQTQLQSGNPERASAPLRQLRELATTRHSRLFELMAELLEAQQALDENREPQALAALARALALGRQQGLLNYYGCLPRVLGRLCAHALEAGIETEYVRGLVQQRVLPPTEDARDLEAWPWPLKIYTFGRLSVLSREQPLAFAGKAQSRPLELLTALIAHGGRGVPEEVLAGLLWPDAEGDAAHRAFDTTLHRLRRLLGHERALLLSDGKLSLNPAVCWVDVWTFERLLGRLEILLKSPAPDGVAGVARLAARLAALYRGPFLGRDNVAAWAIGARERLHSKFLCQLGALGRYWEAAGEWERAADAYHKAIDVHAPAEEYYQRLMLAYRALGRPTEAGAVYQRCRETLLATLGRSPSAGTEALRLALDDPPASGPRQ